MHKYNKGFYAVLKVHGVKRNKKQKNKKGYKIYAPLSTTNIITETAENL